MKYFKKKIVGSLIILSVLFPSVMLLEQTAKGVETQVETASEKVDDSSSLKIDKVHISSESEIEDGVFKLHGGFEDVHAAVPRKEVSSSYYTYATIVPFDIEYDITLKVDDAYGLTVEGVNLEGESSVEYTDESGTDYYTDSFLYVEQNFVALPSKLIETNNTVLINNYIYNAFKGYNGNWRKVFSPGNDDYLGQMYDGDEGFYIAFYNNPNTYSSNWMTELMDPIIINITWDSDYDTADKMKSNSVFHSKIKNNKTDLTFKRRSANTKNLGLSSDLKRLELYSIATLTSFKAKDVYTDEDNYYLFTNPLSNIHDSNAKMNQISQEMDLLSIDFSEDKIKSMEKNENLEYPYFENGYYNFVTATSLDVDDYYDGLNFTYDDLLNKWESGEELVYYSGEDGVIDEDTLYSLFLNISSIRENAYDETPLGKIYSGTISVEDDTVVKNSMMPIKYIDGGLYYFENVTISLNQSDDQYSKFVDLFEDIFSTIDNSDIQKLLNNSVVTFNYERDFYEYDSDGTGQTKSVYATDIVSIGSKAGFLSTSETILIIFATLSLIMLGVAIFFLVKSSNKENEEIEIIGGGE